MLKGLKIKFNIICCLTYAKIGKIFDWPSFNFPAPLYSC